MEQNEGKIDRIVRLVVGLVALYLSINYSLWWLVLAIPALLTTFTGFCCLYKLLGISTIKKLKSNKKKL